MSSNKNKALDQKGFFADLLTLKVLWPYIEPWKTSIYFTICLIPLIAVLQGIRPVLMSQAIDHGVGQRDLYTLGWLCFWFMLAILGEYIFRISQALFSAKAIYKMIANIRKQLTLHILQLPMSYHDQNLSGALVTRTTSDLNNLSESLNDGLLTSIIDLFVIMSCLAGVFYLDFRLGIIVLASLPFVIWIIMYFSAALKKTLIEGRRRIAIVNGFNQECLSAHSTIKLLGAHRDAIQRNLRMTSEYRDTQMRGVIVDAFLFALLDGVASITLGVVLWFSLSIFFDPTKAAISIGTLVAVTQYAQQIFEPLKQLGNKIAMLQGAFTAIERVFGVLNVEKEGKTNSSLETESKPKEPGTLVFKNLSFAYNPNKPVLNDISFSVKTGESLAVIGRTGGGKSTIIKLLSRLYDHYSGEIYLEGQDIRTISINRLRKQIVVVPQDIAIFEGSVLFNISLNDPEVTEARAIEAAKTVGAHSFIKNLSHSYQTQLRERGGNLSVGQKQLIVFARALAKDPNFLILDEATASIDPASENLIQNAMQTIIATKTTIVIAHRISTIEKCSRVILLDEGRILEDSTPQILKQHQSIFSHLRLNQ